MNILRTTNCHIDYYNLILFFTKIKLFFFHNLTANEQMDKFSAEYFLSINEYSYGIPLKCNNDTNTTDGRISIFNPNVN